MQDCAIRPFPGGNPRYPLSEEQEGILPRPTDGNGPPLARLDKTPRVAAMARRRGTIDHERRVADVAESLSICAFATRAPPAHRRLLALAATVHDVGRSVGGDGHELAGATMILQDVSLPLGGSERRAIAYLTRYHRGDVPDAGCDRILSGSDDHASLRVTLALLRAADALDSRSLESPRLVFALRGRALRIACYLDDDSAKARRTYGRRKKFRLLEELLDCRVELDVRFAEALSMVA